MVVPVGDFYRSDTDFDDIFIGMSEAIQEVGWGFHGVVSETGINVDEMLTEVVGVGNRILSVDFVCFDVEHLCE
jgi:hypothetical protein